MIDDPVVDRFLGGEERAFGEEGSDFVDRALGGLRCLGDQDFAQTHRLLLLGGVGIGGRLGQRERDGRPGLRETRSTATAGKYDRRHGMRGFHAVGRDGCAQPRKGVDDGETFDDEAAGRIDIEVNRFAPGLLIEVQELGDDIAGRGVIDNGSKQNNALLQQGLLTRLGPDEPGGYGGFSEERTESGEAHGIRPKEGSFAQRIKVVYRIFAVKVERAELGYEARAQREAAAGAGAPLGAGRRRATGQVDVGRGCGAGWGNQRRSMEYEMKGADPNDLKRAPCNFRSGAVFWEETS